MTEPASPQANEAAPGATEPDTGPTDTGGNDDWQLTPIADMPLNTKLLGQLWPTLPNRYQESPTGYSDALAAIQYGNEVGLTPFEALTSVFVVNGRVSLEGKAMSALIHRAGHQLRITITSTASKVTCFRRDPFTHELTEVGTVEFTDKDAKVAGLFDKEGPWRLYPKVMRTWKAIAQAARFYYADVISGLAYIPDDMDIDAPVQEIPEDVELVIDNEVVEDKVELEEGAAITADVLGAEVVAETIVPEPKEES